MNQFVRMGGSIPDPDRPPGELLDVLERQRQVSERFQAGVMESLAAMVARKEEARRPTRHGETFEDAVFELIQKRSQRAGDVATDTGATTGLIKNCELGPDHAATGTRTVTQAKDKAG